MARFSSVPLVSLLVLIAAGVSAIQSGERRLTAVLPPHYFDRSTPPLTVRHRPPRPSPPPYAVPMEPLVPYSQPDPLYHRPATIAATIDDSAIPVADASTLQTLRKSSDDEPLLGPGPAPDALFPDSEVQAVRHRPRIAYNHHPSHSPPRRGQLYYVREPEPIIEIIIKESNESLPAPPPTQPPPPVPKKEPVHVFYVKYKKDPTKYGKDSVVYEPPVPAVTPVPAETEAAESPAYGPPQDSLAVTAPPPLTTTLRTIIRPESETYDVHGSGLRVTFGGPHDEHEDAGQSESAQQPSLALPHSFPSHSFPGFLSSVHKREHTFFPPPPPPPPPAGPAPFPNQPPSSFSAPLRTFPAAPAPFLRQIPSQTPSQSFSQPPQRQPPQPFHGPPPPPPAPPKSRPSHFGPPPQFQRPALAPPQQPPPFRPAPSTAVFPPPPPPPHGVRSPQTQQYIEQQRKVIQQQQAELFQQQQQQGPQPHILQQLQQQRHQQQLQHQQQLHQQHLQQQRLQQQQRHHPQQPQQQSPQHQTAQQLGFNGEIIQSVPSLEEHLTTREGPATRPPPPSSQLTSLSHSHGLVPQPASPFTLAQSEARQPVQLPHQQPQFQQAQLQYQQYHQQHHQLSAAGQNQQVSRPFSAAGALNSRLPTPTVSLPPTTKPPKVFSLVPSSSPATPPPTTTTTAATTSAAADKGKTEKPLPTLPDEVPEDLRQQLLSSGILSNADIQVLDYDKVGDIPIESLPPEALENFYAAGSAPVPAVVSPNATSPSAKASKKTTASPLPVEMKVVRYDSSSAAGQQLADQYVRADATQLDPVVLNDAGYNRYLPLKVSGVGFPLPDVPELRGRNVTSVVILAPVDYDLLQQGEAVEPEEDGATGDADDRSGRAATIQVKGVRFVTGDILKDLVKNPTGENYKRWLERERKASSEQQAIILLVAEGSGATSKEIFMYDVGSQRVSRLRGKLSSAFVDVAEANATSQDIDNISASSPHIMELRHRGSLDDASAEGSELTETRRPASTGGFRVSIAGGYSKTSAVSS